MFNIPITYNNPLNAYFSNNVVQSKIPNAPDKNYKNIFLIEKANF